MELSNEVSEVLEAMAAVEPKAAAEALERLTRDLQVHGVDGGDPLDLWNPFKRVLKRRGYYVSTPAEIATSLSEIEAIGEGFDLFDLTRGLAQYDLLRMEYLGRPGQRTLPELEAFCAPRPRRKFRKVN